MYRIAKEGTGVHGWAAGVLRSHQVEKTLRSHRPSRLERKLSTATVTFGVAGVALFALHVVTGGSTVAALPLLAAGLVPSTVVWTVLKALTTPVPDWAGATAMEADLAVRQIRGTNAGLARRLHATLHAHVRIADAAATVDALSEDISVEVEDLFGDYSHDEMRASTAAADLVLADITSVRDRAWAQMRQAGVTSKLGKASKDTDVLDPAAKAAALAKASETFASQRAAALTFAAQATTVPCGVVDAGSGREERKVLAAA